MFHDAEVVGRPRADLRRRITVVLDRVILLTPDPPNMSSGADRPRRFRRLDLGTLDDQPAPHKISKPLIILFGVVILGGGAAVGLGTDAPAKCQARLGWPLDRRHAS
jgi:hypothetical protein